MLGYLTVNNGQVWAIVVFTLSMLANSAALFLWILGMFSLLMDWLGDPILRRYSWKDRFRDLKLRLKNG